MSFIIGATGDEGIVPAAVRGGWAAADALITAALSAAVGTYSFIKQHELQQDQLELARAQADKASSLLNLSQSQYSSVAVPVFSRMSALYDRYANTFAPLEPTFLAFAFNPKQYTANYSGMTGMGASCSRGEFGKAKRALARGAGGCTTGACNAAIAMALAGAATEVDADNDAYRFEEDKKRWYDEFYWRKMTTGVKFAAGLESRATSGVNSASHNVTKALSSLGMAYKQADAAVQRQMSALGSMSDLWGGVSNGAFKMFGSSMFDMAGGGGGMSTAVDYGHNFASEHSMTLAVPGAPVAAYY